MPPKKKVEDNADDADRSLLSVDDYTLPKSMILRLAKGVLPANTQIQKDALTAILKSTTVFVNYLASNADDRAQLANKKTIRPEDVFGALEEVEFGGFVERVQLELNKYQDIQNNKRNDYRRRVKGDQDSEVKPAGDQSGAEGDTGSPSAMSQREEKSTTPRVVTLGGAADDTDADGGDEPPAAKKARTSMSGTSRANGLGQRSARATHDGDDDTLSVADEDDEDELEYQSAEEDLPDEDLEEEEDEDEIQDDEAMDDTLDNGSDAGGMNPDPDDDDPGGSDDE